METECKAWYLIQHIERSAEEPIKARLDGEFSSDDLRVIADRVDAANAEREAKAYFKGPTDV